ncbi:hypothetical protein [Tersicoccus sp. Bi-70]|uniref:hypothetical protein n=1 Tax=Tersicoccus sp. Bi-70 TaxID=1897634 RepID=UPI000975FABA|nr:hypothetical protein [Tersicoccus sp. Bi-70]OMH32259.1 hypothetical protein BGP79_07280 [Tersicoccus sp. Bi-70]
MSQTAAAIEAASGRPAPQDLLLVARAELRRLTRRGGLRGTLITATALAVLGGFGTLAVILFITETVPRQVATLPLEVSGFLAALSVAIGTALGVGRDTGGHVRVALTLVPDRRRLFLARALAHVVLGAVAAAVPAALVGGIGCLVGTLEAAPWVALGVLLVVVASSSLTLLAFGAASLVGRSSGAVLILLGVLVILPLALGALGAALPPQLQDIVGGTVEATPTPLMFRAIGVTALPSTGVGSMLTGQAGLAVWGLGVALLALVRFRRQDA